MLFPIFNHKDKINFNALLRPNEKNTTNICKAMKHEKEALKSDNLTANLIS